MAAHHQLAFPVTGTAAAARQARHRVVTAAFAWNIRLGEAELGGIELVAGELIANAVQHAATGPINVEVRQGGPELVITVHDASADLPQALPAGPDSESGRGLHFVSALAHRHGVDLTPTGKRCWAAFVLPLSSTPDEPAISGTEAALTRADDTPASQISMAMPPTAPDRLSPTNRPACSARTPELESHQLDTVRDMTSEHSVKSPTAPDSDQQLREAMVHRLIELGAAESPRVLAAFRAVPRHLATPEVEVAKTYDAEFAAITKTDENGVDISSVSAPRVQAMQIEQADVRPGMRVLEIGSGGVNAAYLAEMVGDDGHVVTVDIDHDVTRRAEDFLKAAGYDVRVTVLTADGEFGAPDYAPFDRIVVTVQAADIPPAWTHQLTDGGRIVVPLRMRGMTRTVALVRDGERLVSDGFELCGFVPMQGAGENRVRLVLLHDTTGEEVGLRLDGLPEPDGEALRAALRAPRVEAWSGVTLAGDESNEHLDLWLTTALDNLPLMAAKIGARQRGLVASASPIGVPTLVDEDSFAYRTVRPTDEPDRYELGAIGHGPGAQKVAERLVEEIQHWDREHRGHRARIEVHPSGTSDDRLTAGRVIDRPHSRVTITWP